MGFKESVDVGMSRRAQAVFSACQQPLDAVIVRNGTAPIIDDNFFYLTGLVSGVFEGCLAVAFPDGRVEAVVSELEAESARQGKATVTVYRSKKEFSDMLQRLLGSAGKIGINADGLTVRDRDVLQGMLPKVSFVDASGAFAAARLVKDAEEIEDIRRACGIADRVAEALPDIIAEGMTENDLAAEIDYCLLKEGAQRPSFDTISSSGANTAMPHYGHGDVPLEQGELVLCDFGAQYHRYASDLTRTWVLGLASRQQREMYEVVLAAQEKAIEAIAAGVASKAVDAAARNVIDASVFKGRFIHSTGHSLGLAVHDGERFSSEAGFLLKENMVFTVEPGVYLPGVGGVRIEDDVRVTSKGCEVLTKASKVFVEL
jgi:Xaa-Pro dipeptidase